MPFAAPTTATVLTWRWALATLFRIFAAGAIAWTLWTYLPILVQQFIVLPMNGGTPFAWLDASRGWVPEVNEWRVRFYDNLRLDAVAILASLFVWLFSRKIANFLVRFPSHIGRCPICRYSLDNLTEPKCPECGFDLPVPPSHRPPPPAAPPPTASGRDTPPIATSSSS